MGIAIVVVTGKVFYILCSRPYRPNDIALMLRHCSVALVVDSTAIVS